MMNKGQIQIGMAAGIMGLIASVGVPFIWGGNVKAKNDVQDAQIVVLEKNQDEIKENVEYIRRLVEQMSIKQGIQGVTGETGAQGVQGFRGVQGVPGADGTDAVTD